MPDQGPASRPRRYFDNAATSFPKPPGVTQALCDYQEQIGASAGRGAYREALEAGRMLERCRAAVRRLFHADPRDHVVFALNGTDALNIAIKSLVRPGEHVVTTALDHNSVLRPLAALEQRWQVRHTIVPADAASTRVDPQDVAAAVGPRTRLVIVNHASNVTGALQPVERIGEICRRRGVWLLVDAAQTAGHVPIDFSAQPIDLLACPGHKGLLGPLGTGILLIRHGLEERLATFREGGTGSNSERPVQPESLPDRLEAGSHNAVGLAGLLAALDWLTERTVAAVREHELDLCRQMAEALEATAELRWFGPRDPRQRVGVFSVRIEGLEPAELSAILEERFGILTRSGLHCAPLAHRTIGTDRSGGTTRLSTGVFTTSEDVRAAVEALAAVAREAVRG